MSITILKKWLIDACVFLAGRGSLAPGKAHYGDQGNVSGDAPVGGTSQASVDQWLTPGTGL